MNRLQDVKKKRERPDHNKNGRRENLFMTTFDIHSFLFYYEPLMLLAFAFGRNVINVQHVMMCCLMYGIVIRAEFVRERF
jgi:hypothetical protein